MSNRYQSGFITASYNGLKVPNAPTIGTATAGDTLATVAFTAPTDVGGGAITGYTATSSPGGFTGTGTASPITVSGLTNGSSYTFTVVATNSYGTSAASAASNSVTPIMAPGTAYGGGYFVGQIGVSGVPTYNLVIAPLSAGQSTLAWKNADTVTPNADSDVNGTQNTADMVADGNATVYPSAHFCNNLSTGGQTDWYMPAKNELEICYYNLKPTTQANNTATGSNINAVPARASNYTSGTPSQTASTDFKSGGTQAFTDSEYWSSTESFNSGAARGQAFSGGYQSPYFGKSTSKLVRAVRKIAV